MNNGITHKLLVLVVVIMLCSSKLGGVPLPFAPFVHWLRLIRSETGGAPLPFALLTHLLVVVVIVVLVIVVVMTECLEAIELP